MKKSLFLFIAILVLLTGCNDKEKVIDENNRTKSTTTKMVTTSVNETNDDEKTNDTPIQTNTIPTPVTTKKENETTKTSKAYIPTTSENKKSTSTTSKTTKSTTKKTTKKTTKNTTKSTTKSTTTTKKATTTKSSLTEKEVYNKMIALKSKYPNGTPWGNDRCNDWHGGLFSRGCGCAGFAFTLSDAAFGSKVATKHTDVSKIRVGDILRLYNNTHSVIVLEVTATGVTIAEGNMTIVGVFEDAVYWGRKITTDELKADVDYILTRW